MSAPEKDLSTLHELQTTVYTRALRAILAALDSEDPEIQAMAAATLNPSLFNAINAFLKNNDITCQPDELNELTATEKRLQNKLKRAGKDMPGLAELNDMLGVHQ